ncbi:hypothetical protein PAECIP111893_01803 [Paenibacillus plantiphilus]|uniref:Uncharacterized protein n=1 Tax=Paenibacillus plantiphilus TaxID=2905650 RepID=A0ABN8GDR9_9BACL|nr:hypothetical protein PAECIP111893_01803 [Paenibacillus plantiphilus]
MSFFACRKSKEWVKELTDGTKMMLKKVNPTNVFFSDGIEAVDEKQVGYFDFKSAAMDEFIYQLMFFFEFGGRTIIGTFNCSYREYADWRDFVFQVIRTIRVIREEDREEKEL